MILTGSEIAKEVKRGDIVIEPFRYECINPNSYNYHLSCKIVEVSSFGNCADKHMTIPEDGIVLKPDRFYLGSTYETLGSGKYAMSLIGRSSLGRLGLFIQASANLGHTGSCHKWTLEFKSCLAIKIYPGMTIGQISFWRNAGDVRPYSGIYAANSNPFPSTIKEGEPVYDPHW
ncbi:dCTP deaminase [Rhizobium etli]|uniref:dCTP deaminase n=1 Tax=Rhizobium etli TaxID=29449 RepID=UPI0003839E5D|nr:deoxycytidine triphosphate deaminase protein [Rhizobium etli]AGS25232.1 deoxycytidine triphosphate deaminase protein [Rhizobium etli bv. mimosae str. Mim1]